jgi:hypothetical protein
MLCIEFFPVEKWSGPIPRQATFLISKSLVPRQATFLISKSLVPRQATFLISKSLVPRHSKVAGIHLKIIRVAICWKFSKFPNAEISYNQHIPPIFLEKDRRK